MIRLGEKSKQIVKEILKVGGEVALVPFRAQRNSIWKSFLTSENKFDGRKFNRTLKGLERNGLIGFSEKNGVTEIYLKKEGKKIALKYSIDDIKIKRPVKWDGKWRVLIFDIPEKHKFARRVLKCKLKELGFMMLQKSVYVFPYDFENEIEFICHTYEIRSFVKVLTAEKIEDSEKLKRIFAL